MQFWQHNQSTHATTCCCNWTSGASLTMCSWLLSPWTPQSNLSPSELCMDARSGQWPPPHAYTPRGHDTHTCTHGRSKPDPPHAIHLSPGRISRVHLNVRVEPTRRNMVCSTLAVSTQARAGLALVMMSALESLTAASLTVPSVRRDPVYAVNTTKGVVYAQGM